MASITEPTRYRRLPLVQSGLFVIGPLDLVADPSSAGIPAVGRLLQPGPGGVVLASSGSDFYPIVDIEIWPHEPTPGIDGSWPDTDQADFTATHPYLLVRSVNAVPAGESFPVATPGAVLRLRAFCRGRAETVSRAGRTLFEQGPEQWLVQIWPLGSGAHLEGGGS